MVETQIRRKVEMSEKRANKSYNQQASISNNESFATGENLRASYDCWSWYYQELSAIRIRMERYGFAVRINDSGSPDFLLPYLAETESFLIKVGIVVNEGSWRSIDKLYLEIYNNINEFFRIRRAVTNKKIPFELIRKLDKLQRVALLIAQKKGLGIRIEEDKETDNAIEQAITGN